jgi:tRNA G18 (ribose-2'-O)-methylase SpoU
VSGFFAIGICHSKTTVNVGTLFRSALNLGASFVFTVGARYKRQSSDTVNTSGNIPLFHFDTVEDLRANLPYNCRLVGIDCNIPGKVVTPLPDYTHHRTCAYLLGAEDHGLTKEELAACQEFVSIPTCPVVPTNGSLNVATAGTLIMYDRMVKRNTIARVAARALFTLSPEEFGEAALRGSQSVE